MTWLAACQYKWDEVAGWNLKQTKENLFTTTTHIFHLFKITQKFSLSLGGSYVNIGAIMNAWRLAVTSDTLWLIFKN